MNDNNITDSLTNGFDRNLLLKLLANDSDVRSAVWGGPSYLKDNIDAAFMIIMAIHIHIMQYGFACLEAGCVRIGSATNSMWKNCISAYVAAIGFWLFGYAISFGKSLGGVVGTTNWAFQYLTDINSWFFQYSFCATTSTITSGAIAERSHIGAYFFSSFLMSSFYYPMVVHWCWNEDGWLNVGDGNSGFVDFAGSGVVHLTGAAAALAAIVVVPARYGRFDSSGQEFQGHSTTLASLGCMILCSGFVAFNAGSQVHISEPGDAYVIGMAAANTMIAGAGGMLSAGAAVFLKTKAFPVMPLHCGLLAGCVAVCAGCNVFTAKESLCIGALAGFCYFGVSILIEKLKLDDPVEAVAVHGGGGIVGLLGLALLHPAKGLIFHWNLAAVKFLAWQVCGIVVISSWSFVITFVIFYTMNSAKLLKAKSDKNQMVTIDEVHGHEPAVHFSKFLPFLNPVTPSNEQLASELAETPSPLPSATSQ